jgi:4-phospho-D-threonate 3-dehydrogenase / 4-phospho-D-erythronate 3-dehydrogenase
MQQSLPRIALTMGDPAGVGPELALRALAEPGVVAQCVPIIFGDASVLRQCAAQVGLPMPGLVLGPETSLDAVREVASPAVLDMGVMDCESFEPGRVSAVTGDASFRYIQRAIDAALAGSVAAVTTCPINKEALHAAGHAFPGHTEMFAARCDARRACMMQYSPEITCSFVTVHCGYAEVPGLLNPERILEVIELTAAAIQRLRGRAGKLVVCGLNPHAGEHGLFGQREEERWIVPAIERARAAGLQVEGPLPPDTCFVPAKRRTTDAFICMYHDQGHIPVKALAFDSAVNTTLGISVVRTSVDHGTACDIAWQGVASPSSLFAALRVATQLVSGQIEE